MRQRAPARMQSGPPKEGRRTIKEDMPADGISAAATKGLRQVLLAARGPVQPSACAGYNVSRPVGRVHSRHYIGLECRLLARTRPIGTSALTTVPAGKVG